MEITQIQPALTSGASAPSTAVSGISSDFDTFLKMLTVQMQNQDPLNPIESSDYAVQLATFSGVEQQVKTNDLLRTLAGQMGASGLADFAGWVGKEVRAPASLRFDGTPLALTPAISDGAISAELVVRDTSGFEVQRLAIDPAVPSIDWAGVSTDGFPLPAGSYQFATVSYGAEGFIAETPVSAYQEVTEVRLGANGAELVLAGGAVIQAETATALRAARPDP